jgi:hypothetical protein
MDILNKTNTLVSNLQGPMNSAANFYNGLKNPQMMGPIPAQQMMGPSPAQQMMGPSPAQQMMEPQIYHPYSQNITNVPNAFLRENYTDTTSNQWWIIIILLIILFVMIYYSKQKKNNLSSFNLLN